MNSVADVSDKDGAAASLSLSQQLYPAVHQFTGASSAACLPVSSACLPVDGAAAAGGGRNPRCARCSNHGVSVPLKGHKAYCTYRRCECDKCQLVVLRRTIMAQQVAWRRRQDLDRLRQQQQQQQQIMVMSKRRKMTSHNDENDELHGHREMRSSTSLVVDVSEVASISHSQPVMSSSDHESCSLNHGGPSGSPVNPPSSSTDAGSLSTLAMIILSYNKNDARLAIDNVRQVAAELNVLLGNEKSVPCNLDALTNSLQVTAAEARTTTSAREPGPPSSTSSRSSLLLTSLTSPPSVAPPSLFTPPPQPPSISRTTPTTTTTKTLPTPFDLFQPYIPSSETLTFLPPPAGTAFSGLVGRLATSSSAAVGEALLPGRVIHQPPLSYLPPPGLNAASPAAAAAVAAAALWTKHWQKSSLESSPSTFVHPFAAASALW